MNEIINYIDVHWVAWLFAAIATFFAWVNRKLSKRMTEDSRKYQAVSDGVQALLRDRIIGAYNHYQDKGFCPIYAKENIKRMYDAYHVLGGNDVATKLKNTLMDMPGEPAEREGQHE